MFIKIPMKTAMIGTWSLVDLYLITTFFLILSAAAATDSYAKDLEAAYTISIDAQELEGARVLLKIGTNIPGTIEMMVGLDLVGQAPDDVWIGESKRIRITNGSAEVELDVSQLPTGQYVAEAAFYPRWGFQDDEARNSGITDEILGKQNIRILGSGVSRELVERMERGQKWVMENVSMGMTWKPKFWKRKFGIWDEFPVTTLNPKIIKNYYFSTIDMTIVVNVLKHEVVTWKTGDKGL